MAPIVLALEHRIKASVLTVGGFWQQRGPPEVEDINFAPRVKTPVLMSTAGTTSCFQSKAPRCRCSACWERQNATSAICCSTRATRFRGGS